MKHELELHCLLNVYTMFMFKIDISKGEWKSLARSPAKLPLPSVLECQKAKDCPTMKKISTGEDTYYTNVCTNLRALYINFEVINAQCVNYFGCKVGSSLLIRMKSWLGMWRRLLDVYTKFQFDISKREVPDHSFYTGRAESVHAVLNNSIGFTYCSSHCGCIG